VATATVSVSTPALVVLGMFGAGVMLMMLSQGASSGACKAQYLRWPSASATASPRRPEPRVWSGTS